jgi:OmpA-OmpF porin, OOP family
MKLKTLGVILSVILATIMLSAVTFAEEDSEGCKDHPLITRMKNFYINICEDNYDAVEFNINKNDETKTIEGHKTHFQYMIKEGNSIPSELQIRRNYANAIKNLGGQVIYDKPTNETLKLIINGKEIWVKVESFGNYYELYIVEVEAMTQEVTADAMFDALNKDGFMALYINFDTGKSTIKSDSQPIINQIASLMKEHDDLKLSIEGHTDNVGKSAANKTLSQQRAKAVLDAVVKQGIAAGRMTAIGWGQEKPIADNRSEDGRSKNRRVEIVKK